MPAQRIGAASSALSSSGIDTSPVARASIISAYPPSHVAPTKGWFWQSWKRP